MAMRAAYAGDLEEAQFQLSQKFKNPRNWKSTQGFPSKKDVQEWERQICEELKCKSSGELNKPKRPNNLYFGMIFEHDGPR